MGVGENSGIGDFLQALKRIVSSDPLKAEEKAPGPSRLPSKIGLPQQPRTRAPTMAGRVSKIFAG